MRRITKSDLYTKTEGELDSLIDEFERVAARSEEEYREAKAILQTIGWIRGRIRGPEP